MNFYTTLRDRRQFFAPTHYSIANYCTETKNEMKTTFGDEYFLDNLHDLIPEPLKKSLADTIITEGKMPPKNEFSKIDEKTNENNQNRTENSPLSGITNFLSGVLNVISSAMFSKPKQTEISSESGGEMALECAWHPAKLDDENKMLKDEMCLNGLSNSNPIAEMGDCRAAAAHCQNKLDQVRLLLSKPVPCTGRVKRRPKKVFVDPSSVEDCFEDAFTPEDFENLSNNSYMEYVSPYCYHKGSYQEISAPKIKTETGPPLENTDIVKKLPQPVKVSDKNPESAIGANKEELVASCEDKLSKLKALLQDRKQRNTDPKPTIEVVEKPPKQKPESKVKDMRFRNPNRCTDKRKQSRMRQNINSDILFANEINSEEINSSVENSPTTRTFGNFIPKSSNLEYFDEISGRFRPTSFTENEDSFQIVFNDSPRLRRTSDCESEDSFIIFDDSPDSCYISNNCYTTNDVFGDSTNSDSCDSDSDLSDSDSGNVTFGLSYSLSKSVSNLTDDSLYKNGGDDEVDCSKVELTVCATVTDNGFGDLLIESKKQDTSTSLPPKKVHFSTRPPEVHVMRVWAFAAKQARIGHWERYALDRERFKRRIADVEVVVSWVLRPQHRSRVMFQRFMPWWNAQKRRELAEKKQREEESAPKVRTEEQIVEDKRLHETEESKQEQEGLGDGESNISPLGNPSEALCPVTSSRLVTLSSVTPRLVDVSSELVVTPSSQSKELDTKECGRLDNDRESNTVVYIVSNDETGKSDNQHLNTRDTETKYLYNSTRDDNNVSNCETLPRNSEVNKLNDQESNYNGAAKLQIKELDNVIHESNNDDSSNISPEADVTIEQNNKEFVRQESAQNGDVIKELDHNDDTTLQDIVHRTETLNDKVNKNDSADTKTDSKNSLSQTKHEDLVHKISNNHSRSENDRGIDEMTQCNQIVLFNDKIFDINNDFIVSQSLRNA